MTTLTQTFVNYLSNGKALQTVQHVHNRKSNYSITSLLNSRLSHWGLWPSLKLNSVQFLLKFGLNLLSLGSFPTQFLNLSILTQYSFWPLFGIVVGCDSIRGRSRSSLSWIWILVIMWLSNTFFGLVPGHHEMNWDEAFKVFSYACARWHHL